MNRQIDKTNLGYLGSDYQYRLVKCFMEDPVYFPKICDVVDQNTFTEPLLKQFVGALKDYYKSSYCLPSYGTMSTLLKSRAKMTSDLEEWDDLIFKLQETSSEGYELTETNATKFFKQQNMLKVANSIVALVKDGDTDAYDQCIAMMQKVVGIDEEENNGFNPYDIIEEVMSPNSNWPIPTGISILDSMLNGGLDKKKLGIVIGSAGFGKTTFSTAISSYASTFREERNNDRGYKVLQICFEDDVKDISKKHFSRLTQIEARNLTKDEKLCEARTKLDNFADKAIYKENLKILKLKTNSKTVDDIRNIIRGVINSGFSPDEIILDYFECLKLKRADKNESKWDMQESTMRALETMAEDFNVALWVMTQGNKESFGAQVVTMAHAGGSVTKVQIGHVVISIARSPQDQANNVATIAILKNRQGGSGQFDGITFNNGTSTITCDEMVPFDSGLDFLEKEDGKKNAEILNNFGQRVVGSGTTLSSYTEKMDEVKNAKPIGKKVFKSTVDEIDSFYDVKI